MCSGALIGLLAWMPGNAGAVVHSVTVSNGIDPPLVVCDGDLDDWNGLDDEIEVHFELADGVNDDWVATGIIHATAKNPGGASLVVTETTIQNITGNQVIAAMILVSHDFPPAVSLTKLYTAHIDGSFDRVSPGDLGELSLAFSATMTGHALGGMNFVGGLVPPPILFDWTGLPFHEDTIIQQTMDFVFYTDTLDDTINLFNSATILPSETVAVEESDWSAIKGLFR